MAPSPQQVEVERNGEVASATVAWSLTADCRWTVTVTSDAFAEMTATEDDAFEALCTVREVLEPLGWRIGVAGAQPDVWPSGMARDQGGGKVAYRMTQERVTGTVETFAPVDPSTTVTVAEQRQETDRLLAAITTAHARSAEVSRKAGRGRWIRRRRG